jgi:ATP-NAD kinase N-terminal domain
MNRLGVDADIKKESDLSHTDIQEKDLVIVIGGDSTYLRTAGYIDSSTLPLLGINSDPSRRTGALLNAEIDHQTMQNQVPRLLEDLLHK